MASNNFVPFQTTTATGYIPTDFVDYFIETGDFEYDGETLCFAEGISDFEQKSQAMDNARNAMIAAKAIKKKPEHYALEKLAVVNSPGGEPEFSVDGYYYPEFGFEINAMSLQITTNIEGKDKILVSTRSSDMPSAPNTIDFVAGGTHVLKFSDPLDALVHKAVNKSGIDESIVRKAEHVARVHLKTLSEHKGESGNVVQCLEQGAPKIWNLKISEDEAHQILTQNEEGNNPHQFTLASAENIIEYCANGRIHPIMVQSFMASLIATDMMPKSEFVPEIKAALEEKGGCVFKQKPSDVKPKAGLRC